MSRTLDKEKAKHDKEQPASERRAAEAAARRRESPREFIEQIVVAFILAFLVRGFEAEAFVIPTGSMAPTLMGMHKEVACPHCGYTFPINASEEFEPRAGGFPQAIVAGICGNCRAPVRIDEEPSFNGDRILVMKFLYDLPVLGGGQPDRWDVVVFHYPEEPETNYIKRLVGMPNEDLRIYFGDILTRPRGSTEPFRLRRKPLRHQEAMQMNVWDDRYRPRLLADQPEWQRWRPKVAGSWRELEPGHYATAAGDEWTVLRYHHLVPDFAQWEALLNGDPLPYPPKTSLVSDFYSYNTGEPFARRLNDGFAPQWVGDLTVSATIESKSNTGSIRLELIEGGVPNTCKIDLATGQATLGRGGAPIGEPVTTPLKGQGEHDVKFANVDGRLTLWVDGQTPFGEGLTYEDGSNNFDAGHPIPTWADLEPVGIAAKGAEVTLSDLVLKRDIYYTLDPGKWDYEGLGFFGSTTLSEPSEFANLKNLRWAEFSIQPGHYMMLGDNSPRSKDGRGWGLHDREWDHGNRQSWEVPEALLIGKAFFVYWPHGKPMWPNIAVNKNTRLPFRPYVERMKWIR